MRPLLTMCRLTWLATALFLATSMAVWGAWLSPGAGLGSIVPTLLICPIVWWWLVARKSRPKAVLGLLAGAMIGPLTQAVPDLLPIIWKAYSRKGLGDGDAQAAAMVTVVFYLFVGLASTVIGAFVGFVAAVLQGRIGPSVTTSVEPEHAIPSRTSRST